MSVRRVRIHCDREGDPVAVDVTLPAGAPVGELLPAIVDMVDGRAGPPITARHWRLERLGGAPLDESSSLYDNVVEDGDLLILSHVDAAPLGPGRSEPCRAAALAAPSGDGVGLAVPDVLCVVTTVLASAALAWAAGSANATTNLIVAAVGTCVAAAVTVATGHSAAAGVAVVTLAAATGFLAVPSTPAAPNVFLAAVAAFSAALLLLRLSGRASTTLTATATCSLLAALVTLTAMPAATVGAALAATSLGLLALAPRVAVLAAGLGPERWNDDVTQRASAGHALLSGLVAGSAAGAASGTVLVAVGGAADPRGVIAFTGLIAVTLLLRTRCHVEPIRRLVLLSGGWVGGAACLWFGAAAYREHVGVLGGVLVAIGLVAVARPSVSVSVARWLGPLECAAVAAVVPVACWVGGVYGYVGGLAR